jgi:hypothetical protein
MSISPINNNAQTGLVPSTLLGYSNDGVSAIEITPTSITLGGDLNTTPIYVEVSASTGLTTNRVGGLNVNCDFDMNSNNITNVSNITNSGDINISAGSDFISLGGNKITLTGGGDGINITDNGANIQLTTDQDINMNSDQYTNITTGKLITLTSQNDNIYLTAPSGKTYINKNGVGDGEIVAVNFVGDLSGTANYASTAGSATTATTATTATKANQLATTGIASSGSLFYLPIVSNNTTNPSQIVYTDNNASHLTYNITSGNLTSPIFTGALSGTATNATNCFTQFTSTSATYYPVFTTSNSTGYYSQNVGTMTYNASTNTLTANTFNGVLSGTATNSTNSAITDDNTNATFYPVFVSNNTGNLPLKVDKTTNPFTYNPSTGNLSSSIFTGSANITNAVNNVSVVATTLTLDFSSLTFKNFYNSTAITTAITQSAVAFSNAVAGGSYMFYITTGVGGSFTFNTGISGIKTTFATAFTIPASSVGVMSIYYINSVYIVGINILT